MPEDAECPACSGASVRPGERTVVTAPAVTSSRRRAPPALWARAVRVVTDAAIDTLAGSFCAILQANPGALAIDAALPVESLIRARTGAPGPRKVSGGPTAGCATSPPDVKAAAGRPPLAETWRSEPSEVTVRLPSRSVRSTFALIAWSRSTVAGLGCPYGLPSPALMSATLGCSASRRALVVAVRLP